MDYSANEIRASLLGYLRWAALGFTLLAASCAANDPTQLLSVEQEKRLGESVRGRLIEASGGLYRDRDAEAYLSDLMSRILPAAQVPPGFGTPKVSILDTAEPNAYAIAGGSIFVTRGMLAFVSDEAELAGVLAHEIAHVAERHVAEGRVEQEKLIRSVQRASQDELRYSGGARSRQLRILQTAYNARVGELTDFSKSQELEADQVGLAILGGTEFSAAGLERVVARHELYKSNLAKRVGLTETELSELVAASSYPKTDVRLAELQRLQGAAPDGPREQDRLMEVIDGIAYGEDFNSGYVRDDRFWKPGARISFAAPSTLMPVQFGTMGLLTRGGFIVFHSASDDNSTIEQIVNALVDPEFRADKIREKTINGLAVKTSTTEYETNGTPYQVRTHVYAVGSDKHSLTMFRETDKESELPALYSQIVDSFRVVEGGAWPKRPRLRTRKVAAGDTVETLAAASALNGDKEFEFRLLNGLQADEPLRVGHWIKVVE